MEFQLIYHSIAIDSITKKDIKDILDESIEFNTRHHITGCLLFYQGEFVQILEGTQKIIEELYDKITKDFRHHHVYLVHKGKIENRKFNHWSMAYKPLNEDIIKKIQIYLGVEDFIKLNKIKEEDTLGEKLFKYTVKQLLESDG